MTDGCTGGWASASSTWVSSSWIIWPKRMAPAIRALPLMVWKSRISAPGTEPSAGRSRHSRRLLSTCGISSSASSKNTGPRSGSISSTKPASGSLFSSVSRRAAPSTSAAFFSRSSPRISRPDFDSTAGFGGWLSALISTSQLASSASMRAVVSGSAAGSMREANSPSIRSMTPSAACMLAFMPSGSGLATSRCFTSSFSMAAAMPRTWTSPT